MVTQTRQRMSAEDAQSFSKVSQHNANMILANRKCSCNPYQDWFTFKRWIAQGKCVNKGEHGLKLACYAPGGEVDNEDTGQPVYIGKQYYSAWVFCRCQVHDLEDKRSITNNAPASTITNNAQTNDIPIKLTSPLTGNTDLTFLSAIFAANVAGRK